MVLLEALAGQESLKYAGIPDSLLEKEHRLKIDIIFYEKKLAEIPDSSTEANYRSKLFTANRQYEELIVSFEKQFPDYYNLKYTAKNPTVKDVQNLIDQKTALRSYFVGDSVIYIFTITKKELNVARVPKMENFDDSLKHFRYGLTFTSQRMKDYYRRLGYSFYQQLFPDVFDKNIQNIIIVPDGNLGIIPFESLLTTDYSGNIDNYKDYPYLIKKYNISYSYSANLFAKTFSKDKTKDVEFTNLNDWLAFAPVFSNENKSGTALISRELRNTINKSTDDSLMTRGTLISGEYINPLPGTEQETQNIFNLYNQKNKKAQLLLYDKANENYLKSGNLNQFKIIHFATHGFANSEKPELSGIILNQDTTGGEDGILYSGELYNLKMNADLVVLSACETGLGKIRKGEGIIGLTRALLYAGAKNIVVSLWQVSDKSTSDLMIDFYKNITENEKQNHSKSLQQAKLKMINESNYAHPFYWSPFILIGK
jgi:CHAT domain-containing protein